MTKESKRVCLEYVSKPGNPKSELNVPQLRRESLVVLTVNTWAMSQFFLIAPLSATRTFYKGSYKLNFQSSY